MAYGQEEPKAPPIEKVLGLLSAVLGVIAAAITLVKANRKKQRK